MGETTSKAWASPRQARGLESMKRMLDAAQELLETVHFSELKVQDIVKKAETSIGSFYNRFKTKDGLLHCLESRYVEEHSRVVEGQIVGRSPWKEADLGERVSWLTRLIVKFNRERRGLLRTIRIRQILGKESATAPGPLDDQGPCSSYIDFLLERRAEIGHPHPEQAVRIGCVSMVVTLDQFMLFDGTSVQSVAGFQDEVLAVEMSNQLLSYLGWIRTQTS
jgi:AcrR family transcriptional regulator